jgi:hypothetical protein
MRPDKSDYRRAGWPAPQRPAPPWWSRLALAGALLLIIALYAGALLLLGP